MRGGEERIGPYTYRWDAGCFPLSADSLALGRFAGLRPGDRVLDLGCGAGLLLLLCAERVPCGALAGVERDETAAAWARRNLAENGLAGEIITGDLRTVPLPGERDLVLTNPPWYRRGSGRAGGPGKMEEACTLPELCGAAAGALRSKGRLAVVYDPARLPELLAAMAGKGVEPKRLQLVQHRRDTPPCAVLAEGIKGGRPGLSVLPVRFLEEEA